MKTTFIKLLFLVLFITNSAFSSHQKLEVKSEKKTLIFQGITVNDDFKFIDEKQVEFFFYDVDEEVEISLYDEELIGVAFEVEWKEVSIYVTDENGENTEETKIIKRIISLKEVQK
jgi:hypothetical protein